MSWGPTDHRTTEPEQQPKTATDELVREIRRLRTEADLSLRMPPRAGTQTLDIDSTLRSSQFTRRRPCTEQTATRRKEDGKSSGS